MMPNITLTYTQCNIFNKHMRNNILSHINIYCALMYIIILFDMKKKNPLCNGKYFPSAEIYSKKNPGNQTGAI